MHLYIWIETNLVITRINKMDSKIWKLIEQIKNKKNKMNDGHQIKI